MDRYYTEQEVGDVAKQIIVSVSSKNLVHVVDGVDISRNASVSTTSTSAVAGATVLALSGDLGAGKTTLTKAIAAALGVQETVISPTFVIAKYYECQHANFDQMVHIDAYRIDEESEHHILNWQAISEMPRTLIVVEWPDRVAGLLPQHTYYFDINHVDGADGEHNRHIALRSHVDSTNGIFV